MTDVTKEMLLKAIEDAEKFYSTLAGVKGALETLESEWEEAMKLASPGGIRENAEFRKTPEGIKAMEKVEWTQGLLRYEREVHDKTRIAYALYEENIVYLIGRLLAQKFSELLTEYSGRAIGAARKGAIEDAMDKVVAPLDIRCRFNCNEYHTKISFWYKERHYEITAYIPSRDLFGDGGKLKATIPAESFHSLAKWTEPEKMIEITGTMFSEMEEYNRLKKRLDEISKNIIHFKPVNDNYDTHSSIGYDIKRM